MQNKAQMLKQSYEEWREAGASSEQCFIDTADTARHWQGQISYLGNGVHAVRFPDQSACRLSLKNGVTMVSI